MCSNDTIRYILRYIRHPRNLSCLQRQHNLTYVDYAGFLHLVPFEAERFRNSPNCSYVMFERHPEKETDGKTVNVSVGSLSLEKPVKLLTDMVKVICYQGENETDSKMVYFNLHAHPIEREKSFLDVSEEK